MTTLQDRPNTALLVVDVQRGVVAAAYHRDDVVANIGVLIDRARAAGTPVVWVQHSDDGLERGSEDWQIVPELSPAEAEQVVEKHWADAFEETALAEILAGQRVGRLMVVGAETDACIRSTIHGGFTRGYDVVLVSDAHTANDQSEWGAPPPDVVISYTNLYWTDHAGPGRTAGTVETSEVEFGDQFLDQPRG